MDQWRRELQKQRDMLVKASLDLLLVLETTNTGKNWYCCLVCGTSDSLDHRQSCEHRKLRDVLRYIENGNEPDQETENGAEL